MQNSQCTVDASHSSVTGAGPTLTVNLDITLTQSVAGLETIYGWVLDNSGQSSGAWSALGTCTPIRVDPTLGDTNDPEFSLW